MHKLRFGGAGLLVAVCAVSLVMGGCGRNRAALTESAAEVTATPTEAPHYEPESAADLAEKTAGKLEGLKSVHMDLTADVTARIDLLGTIMSGIGNIGNGESFVPDLGSILGNSKADAQGGVQKTSASSKASDSQDKSDSQENSAFSMKLRYDADIQSRPAGMHFYGSADVNILGSPSRVPVEAYYFEENGEHALYTQTDGVWERQVVEMESVSPSLSSDFFRAIASGTVQAGLSDMNVEVNGCDTYRMNVTISGDNIKSVIPLVMGPLQNAVENDETLGPLFGTGSESIDFSNTTLPIKIYIDRETLYPVQMRLDMTEFGKTLLDSLSVVKMDVDEFETVINYSKINETSAGEPPI